MGKSYRLRTTPGVDENIVVQVDQDFEQLEVLSLKIRQRDTYLRMCSDYGVIAGRVFANKGYGIPNAKVSVFIPLLPEDENNPVITSVYPYKGLEDTNEDGYKYNLLPYTSQYSNHVPTGTYPTREDALINQTVVELFDKYYKFTVTTNDSGDFMIFGVPVGTQILVMNVDLSDIGPFSLSPADLIRMGVATEDQVDGTKFKASTNFNELPQIVVINKTIEIVPFWGEKDVCQIGITRTDFDLTSEANIDIKPTSIFMGSLMSSSEKTSVSPSGRPKKATGDLCRMITGPGEIISITQTINRDNNGLPILERAPLPNGGKLIDSNGVWMFDVPMNMDYVTTNEFGQQVLSNDPSVGIPTKGKYRFKIKWQQSTSLSEDYKRAYYLVPNVREKGWSNSGSDPLLGFGSTQDYWDAQRSYGFDLNWTGYTAKSPINITNPDIKAAVDCEDTFYEFDYNKVYTVSSFVDNWKPSSAREKFLGIKRIDEDTCEDSVNRYPVNDGVMHTSIIWLILNILIIIIGVLFALIILPIYHIIAWIWGLVDDDGEEHGGWFVKVLLVALLVWLAFEAVKFALAAISAAAGSDVGAAIGFGIMALACIFIGYKIVKAFNDVGKPPFRQIHLQMITYPDCDTCDCDGNNGTTTGQGGQNAAPPLVTQGSGGFFVNFASKEIYSKILDVQFVCFDKEDPKALKQTSAVQSLLAGQFVSGNCQNFLPIPSKPADTDNWLFTFDLPFGERINRFNVKYKYHEGYNRISVRYEPTITFNQNRNHYDNVLAFVTGGELESGDIFSFVNPKKSLDPNIKSGVTNQFGTKGVTGFTNYSGVNQSGRIDIIYADPNNRTNNLTQSYEINTTAYTDEKVYSYASDVEYFQVITGMTVTQYRSMVASGASPKSFAGIINSQTTIVKLFPGGNINNSRSDHNYRDGYYNAPSYFCCSSPQYGVYGGPPIGIASCTQTITNMDLVETDDMYVVFVQRGVDPYSPKYNTEIGLGKLFGYSNENTVMVNTDLRLNIPIRNTTAGTGQIPMARHDQLPTNASSNNGFNLYFESYIFTPDVNNYSGYSTNLHSYYSDLDRYSNYLIDPSNSSSNIIGKVINTNLNNTNDTLPLTTSNIFYGDNGRNQLISVYNNGCSALPSACNGNYPSGNDSKHYYNNESLAGGSYMYFYYNGSLLNMTGWYYSHIYPTTITTNMNDSAKIVMRSDRLPAGDTATTFCNGTALLQQNYGAKVYLYDGGSYSVSANLATPQFGQGFDGGTGNTFENTVLNSFGCEGMIGLNCYSGDGLNFGIKTPCNEEDNVVKNGCYAFVKNPIKDIPKDVRNMFEYSYRFRFFYALCQGVLSNVFNNNWVNGNLYAYPFKINTYYNSQNQVGQRQYAGNLVVLQQDTNNFYYRSSPYNTIQNKFIGSQGGGQTNSNYNQIKTPTTIMNLGPRDYYLKELVLNGDFEGYIMNKMESTTYKDLSETINFFSIIRIVSAGFWQKVAGDQIARLFSRPTKRRRVDADFAQTAAINSQLGVITFDTDFYDTTAPAGQVPSAIAAGFNPGGNSPNEVMMGVYFSSSTEDMQLRDYISPGRIFRFNNGTNTYSYDYTPIKSQKVPHYRWDIDPNQSFSIFGKQTNEWATKTAEIEGLYYQKMDRLVNNYPKGLNGSFNGSDQTDYRGYLFSVSGSGPTRGYVLLPTTQPKTALGGAPWYFYFGLKKGNTAMDKFYQKYIGEGNLNE